MESSTSKLPTMVLHTTASHNATSVEMASSSTASSNTASSSNTEPFTTASSFTTPDTTAPCTTALPTADSCTIGTSNMAQFMKAPYVTVPTNTTPSTMASITAAPHTTESSKVVSATLIPSTTETFKMDPVTGKDYEPIDESLMAYIHSLDPGFFSQSVAGILYCIYRNIMSPSALPFVARHAFRINCPKEKLPATYTHAYRRWAATSPDAFCLRRHLSISVQGREEFSTAAKIAIFCGKVLAHKGGSRQAIIETVREQLVMKRNGPISEKQHKDLDWSLRELPESVDDIWMPLYDVSRLCHEPFGQYADNVNPERIFNDAALDVVAHNDEAAYRRSRLTILTQNRKAWERMLRHRRLLGNCTDTRNMADYCDTAVKRAWSPVEDLGIEDHKDPHQIQHTILPASKRQRLNPAVPRMSIREEAQVPWRHTIIPKKSTAYTLNGDNFREAEREMREAICWDQSGRIRN